MSEQLGLYWIILAAALLLSAFFAASETALMALGKVRLRRLKERHARIGPVVERLAQNPDQLLSAILLGKNLSDNAATSAATVIAIALVPWNPILVATVTVTIVMLIFSDIMPKVIAASQSERISLLVARPIDLLSRIASPLLQVLTIGPRLFLRIFGITAGHPETTSDDIKTIATLGREEGILGEDETDMIHSVVEFGGITVAEIMVPRVEIEGLDSAILLEAAIDQVVEMGHSRIPVFRESLDDIVGILYARDLLVAWRSKTPVGLESLLRPPLFVSEHQRVSELFREFRARNLRMAIVVDEYGGTAGLVTLEDVIAEIVGEIADEHRAVSALVPMKDGTFLVSGQIAIEELNEKTGLALSEEDFQNLSGLLVNHLGRVPYVGEQIVLPGALFNVLDADHRRIYKLSLKKGKPGRKPGQI